MFQRHPIQNQHMMFVTTNTKDRSPVFSNPAHARVAVDTLYIIQLRYPFSLYAFVIMPDHCHFLLHVPEDGSISKILHAYKRGVTFTIGTGPLWQDRFDLKIPSNASKVREYIHSNPVAAKLCTRQDEYMWSSASGKWDLSDWPLL